MYKLRRTKCAELGICEIQFRSTAEYARIITLDNVKCNPLLINILSENAN